MSEWGPALEITTAKICPVNCYPFCPQLKFRDAYDERAKELPMFGASPQHDPGLLSFEDFCKAIETVPTGVWISFAGFSEPFINSRALDMMEYARRKGHRINLNSTLVGLRPKDIPRIKAVHPETFTLHPPDDAGVAHINVTENYKDVLALAFTQLDITGYSRMGSHFVSNERAGNCDNAPPRKVHGPFQCDKLVEPEFVMLPNCDAVLCCMDWTLRHVVGNLLTTSWDAIREGPAYQEIVRSRRRLSGGELCRSCKWATPLISTPGVRQLLGKTIGKVGAGLA